MRRTDFETMVREMVRELPPEFLEGIAGVEVTGKTVPHPVREDIFTLGECLPHTFGAPDAGGPGLRSTIYLHYGSFAALAEDEPGFDWRTEAWETLTHELRHHLEWRANLADLEAYDWAAEQNFARHEGRPFDPVFYRNGETVAERVTKVDDDVFIETDWNRAAGLKEIVWHGRRYRVRLPAASRRATVFVTLEGLADPPPGEAVLVTPGKASIWSLFRSPAAPVQVNVAAEPLDA